jgi:hypothetical protein
MLSGHRGSGNSKIQTHIRLSAVVVIQTSDGRSTVESSDGAMAVSFNHN